MLGINPIVIKNDEMKLEEIKKLSFSRILLSPGWGNPDNAGITMEIIDYYKDRLPILGVCLGNNSNIYFDEDFELFKGLKQGFSATRYHSLMVSNCLYIKAYTEDKIPMALKIKDKPIYGIQFHPEAILTENGIKIFENWINS